MPRTLVMEYISKFTLAIETWLRHYFASINLSCIPPRRPERWKKSRKSISTRNEEFPSREIKSDEIIQSINSRSRTSHCGLDGGRLSDADYAAIGEWSKRWKYIEFIRLVWDHNLPRLSSFRPSEYEAEKIFLINSISKGSSCDFWGWDTWVMINLNFYFSNLQTFSWFKIFEFSILKYI